MKKIYGIGETLIDIIFKGSQPLAANPGGSILNSLVSLGRIGLPVSLISEYGDDALGRIIDNFLAVNGVESKTSYHFTEGSTALAVAILNKGNDASYTFYKNYPPRRLLMQFPVIKSGDILLCGSIYSITREIRNRFTELIASALNAGALILYDPNFRKAHASDLNELKPFIIENMRSASLIRGSDEDFLNIFGTENPEDTWEITGNYCDCLVYTNSRTGVFVKTKKTSCHYPVRNIRPVSTIGAGDAFNAGMIAALFSMGTTRDELNSMDDDRWEKVITSGIDFATDVCLSFDNYISQSFKKGYMGNH